MNVANGSRIGPYDVVAIKILPERFASGKAKPFIARDGAAILDGVFSPDGRYVAYSSNESGRMDVYVTTFPNAIEPAWRLTSEGARVISLGGRSGDEILGWSSRCGRPL
jgi:hypothetical protein